MKTIKKTAVFTLTLILLIGFSSCNAIKNTNNKQRGAVIGATSGAILGAILGKKGKKTQTAIIGGAIAGAAGVLIGNKMDKQAQRIEEEIPGAIVERVEDGIIITFDENSGVFFETNKYNINTNSQIILDKLSVILEENPDTNVLVVGHTDSVGAEKYNLKLSENRAYAVTHFFTQTKGLSQLRFTTNWFGEAHPTHDNSTTEGRAKNRRVNIVIVPNKKMLENAQKEAGED